MNEEYPLGSKVGYSGTNVLPFPRQTPEGVLPKHEYIFTGQQCATSQMKFVFRVCSCENKMILVQDPHWKESLLIPWFTSRKFNIFRQNYE